MNATQNSTVLPANGYAIREPERVNSTQRGCNERAKGRERGERDRKRKRGWEKEKEERKVGRLVEGKRVVNAGVEDGGRRGEGAACAREGRVRGYRSVVSVAAAANLRLSATDRQKTEKESDRT